MSSNITVSRVCKHCGKDFTAKTTVTKYCSAQCTRTAYKARLRNGKVDASNKETSKFKTAPIDTIKAKEFLTVRDLAKLLNCSSRTAYRLISNGTIHAINLLERKTIVRRSDVDKLFDQPMPSGEAQELTVEIPLYQIEDCYNLTEVQSIFGISEKALHELIRRNDIPKIKKGWYAYVPKSVINKLLGQKINLQTTV